MVSTSICSIVTGSQLSLPPDLLDAELNEEDDDFLVSAPVHDLDFSENDRSLNEIPDSSDHESVKEKYTMEQIHTRLFRMKPTEGNNFI